VLLDNQIAPDATRVTGAKTTDAMTGTLGLPAEPVWRQEVVSRVQQHRARRRRHSDPNALELDFTANEPFSFTPPPPRFAEIMVKAEPKVIRFPRPSAGPMSPMQEIRMDELQPTLETPRIFEAEQPEAEAQTEAWEEESRSPEITDQPLTAAAAPEAEQMELLPSFADIRLEPAAARIAEDEELIPRPAALGQRAVAGALDAAIVAAGAGLFALTFLKLAEEIPHSKMTLVCLLAAGGLFWLLFQYLFLTYGRTTPGMRLAELELCTFTGGPPPRPARQCRALASALSGFSAGLGYAWAFIDEDRLGWHDRMTQTYVRQSGQHSAISGQRLIP